MNKTKYDKNVLTRRPITKKPKTNPNKKNLKMGCSNCGEVVTMKTISKHKCKTWKKILKVDMPVLEHILVLILLCSCALHTLFFNCSFISMLVYFLVTRILLRVWFWLYLPIILSRKGKRKL